MLVVCSPHVEHMPRENCELDVYFSYVISYVTEKTHFRQSCRVKPAPDPRVEHLKGICGPSFRERQYLSPITTLKLAGVNMYDSSFIWQKGKNDNLLTQQLASIHCKLWLTHWGWNKIIFWRHFQTHILKWRFNNSFPIWPTLLLYVRLTINQ